MLKFTTLASSSLGNAALVSCGDTHILLDAGISAKRISNGLQALGIAPAQLSAVLITHTHSDHVTGLRVLAKKAGAPIYATPPACREWYGKNRCDQVQELFQPQEAGTGVQIGSLWVESFPTPHDAPGSVGYSIAGEKGRMVLCTDLGHVTREVLQVVEGILGDYGHLSNEAGAELAAFAVESGTKTVVLAHLSQTNNTPVRAYETVCLRLLAMDCDLEQDISLSVAPAEEPGPTLSLGKEAAAC